MLHVEYQTTIPSTKVDVAKKTLKRSEAIAR